MITDKELKDKIELLEYRIYSLFKSEGFAFSLEQTKTSLKPRLDAIIASCISDIIIENNLPKYVIGRNDLRSQLVEHIQNLLV